MAYPDSSLMLIISCRKQSTGYAIFLPTSYTRNDYISPAPSMIKIPKPLCWVFWPILTGTKQRFRISIIVGDPCSTVRWGHTQLFKFGMDERAFHSRTIVAMQYERMVATLFAQHGTMNDCGAIGHGFSLKHFMANDLAAVDINNEIQIEELTSNLSRQVGHVPAPANIGFVCTMSAWWPLSTRRCLAAPAMLFIGGMEDAVKTRLRS